MLNSIFIDTLKQKKLPTFLILKVGSLAVISLK